MYFIVCVHFVGVLKTQFLKTCTEWKLQGVLHKTFNYSCDFRK